MSRWVEVLVDVLNNRLWMGLFLYVRLRLRVAVSPESVSLYSLIHSARAHENSRRHGMQVVACTQRLSAPFHRFTAAAHTRRLAHPAPARQVACFLARRGLVSLALVRHVYCATFPSFAPLFAEGLARLVALQARA